MRTLLQFMVTLFANKINSLVHVIIRQIMYSLYVDDLLIAFSSCNQSVSERKVHTTGNRYNDGQTKKWFLLCSLEVCMHGVYAKRKY